MKTIDYIYRFDPQNPSSKPPPADAASARRALEEGNRLFARWMASCQGDASAGEPRFVLPCNAAEVGLLRKAGGAPQQAPFAVVVGCSDARVPTEMTFGQGFNNLFVIRVAGNVLGDVCLGSIDFAVTALSESVRVVLVLGHTGCGAVTGAVDAYLRPQQLWSATPALRAILEKLLMAVRAAANGLKEVWGPECRQLPGYRDALIEAAVCVNAAQTAYDLRQSVAEVGKEDVEVLCGVYNLYTHQVSLPTDLHAPPSDQAVSLAPAPSDPREFHDLAVRAAGVLRPTLEGQPVPALAARGRSAGRPGGSANA
jgi:carbonic anhydrase